MPKKIFIDTETCGLHGMAVLIQWAEEDGPIHLHDIWKVPVSETMKLIEYFCENIFVGFNNAFDWFHLAKIYTIWALLPSDWIPEEHIEEIAQLEPKGRDGLFIKPYSSCDLLLHSRKGPYQSLMARKDIRIRRIPTALAYALANELEQRIEIDGIYFAKTADKEAPQWKVLDIVAKSGAVNQDFKDVVLKFNAAGGLKYLAEHALGLKPKHYFTDVELDASWRPYELGYAPYALAVASAPDWECWEKDKLVGMAWPALIHEHIRHWHESQPAREYAYDDVVYTRKLYEHFGSPEPGDDDSILACMVACVRWRGFKYDRAGLEELQASAQKILGNSPININQPPAVRAYINTAMDDIESVVLEETTKRSVLEHIQGWIIEEPEGCTKCEESGVYNDSVCNRCGGTGLLKEGPHPAATRARELLQIKIASKELELYQKLLRTDRFHASFKIIGTLSSRMSGSDGLNAQGIKHDKNVRKMFPLAWSGYVLCGGDFDAFEVTLADAVFDDPILRQTLLEGKKIHALLGMELFPGKTYDEIVASDGTEVDLYTKSKQGMFGFLYGGDESTWNTKLGIPLERAKKAFDKWCARYPGIGRARMKIYDCFCSMRQPKGLGTQVVWKDPQDYCETFLGFRRYFTLENKICQALFELANKMPREWQNCKIKVVRRDREQTAKGAVASALYGCAFQIQAANMRAANNHLIQSPGAEITKRVQRKIWDLQPVGAHPACVMPMNVHDEIMCATAPDYVDPMVEVVRESVESFRPQVPLLGLKWNKSMDNWAEKKAGSSQVHITYER